VFRLKILILLVTLVAPLECLRGHAQGKSERLTFDVATIKPADPAAVNGSIRPLPGGVGYHADNISVKLMISLMYRIPMRQITGGPEWLETVKFDVEAKADGGYSVDDLHLMFQNLLANRFGLKLHREEKIGPVYSLTVDKSGLKMKANESPEDFKIPMNFGDGGTVGRRVPMPYLCWWLGQQLQSDERPVVDHTGLKGNYDFTIRFAREVPPGTIRDNEGDEEPSIFAALREQLGLRLVPEKGTVEILVIDSVEKPSAN
jgi:uncharacterized protein (TIGR03435 family)